MMIPEDLTIINEKALNLQIIKGEDYNQGEIKSW